MVYSCVRHFVRIGLGLRFLARRMAVWDCRSYLVSSGRAAMVACPNARRWRKTRFLTRYGLNGNLNCIGFFDPFHAARIPRLQCDNSR